MRKARSTERKTPQRSLSPGTDDPGAHGAQPAGTESAEDARQAAHFLPDLEKDQKIIELAKSASRALVWAKSIRIRTQSDAEKVAHGIQASRDAKDQVREREKHYSQPLKTALALFGTIFTRYYSPWREVDQVLTDKLTGWRTEEKRKRDEAIREAEALAETPPPADTLLPKGKQSKPAKAEPLSVDPRPIQPTPPAAVTGKVVNLHFQKRWTYELVDLAKVPKGMTVTMVDDAKVKAEIAKGVREIPGLRIYQTESPRRTG